MTAYALPAIRRIPCSINTLFASLLCLFCCIGTASSQEHNLGDWGSMSLPDSYSTGTPFTISVTVKELAAPSKLIISANANLQGGKFGGFLQMLQNGKTINGPGTFDFTVTIKKEKPNMAGAILVAYISDDGNWKTRKKDGQVKIALKAGETKTINETEIKTKKKKNNMETLGEKSEKTEKAKPFVSATAPNIASLSEAGFTPEPSLFDDFEDNWPQKSKLWRVATWKQNGTKMSVENCKVNGEGQLVQTVKAGKPFRGGSMQSKQEFGWGRWIARVKTSEVPGVLNSIFTKDWDDYTTPTPENDGKKGEVDIELLSHTYGPNTGEVHLAIHLAKHAPLWHLDIPLDFNPSDDYHEWGFDILPDRVIWHVNGKFLHEWKYTEEHFIDPGYEFFFNSWTMPKWIKGPPEKDAEYHIDWVKFYPLQEK